MLSLQERIASIKEENERLREASLNQSFVYPAWWTDDLPTVMPAEEISARAQEWREFGTISPPLTVYAD